MNGRKILNILLLIVLVASLAVGRNNASAQMPSPVDEMKIPHYFGPYPNWANSPFTLPDVAVTIAPPATVSYGNALVDRGYPTDNEGIVFVVNTHTPLVNGVLTAFQTWAQAGSGPNTFNAFVLRPTPGVANSYTIVLDSGPFTVLDTATGLQTFPLAAPFAVQDGDLIAHYGKGIPIDIGLGVGQDTVFYPANTAPALGTAVDVVAGDATFPLCGALCSDRTYSFAASTGMGATAEAIVGANGAVTGFTVTNPGSGYTSAPAVAITGAGTGATAVATVTLTGFVTSITVEPGSSGYTSPFVTISGGGATIDATATAYGSIEKAAFEAQVPGGSGYTFPTIDIDMPDDPNGVQARAHVASIALGDPVDGLDANGVITAIVLDEPGSGYAVAPHVVIRDGTLSDPINNGGTGASATTTLSIQSVVMDTFGAGYTSAPTVFIGDTNGFLIEAVATAHVDAGGVTTVDVVTSGSGYITPGGIRKFVDTLPGVPGVTPFAANNLGQYIPLAVPDITTFPDDPNTPENEGADYYEIAVVQHREKMHSDLPASLLREYVQLHRLGVGQTCADVGGIELTTSLLVGTEPTLMPDGSRACGYDNPHYLGPTIVARKDRAVRITFYNLLPDGVDGDLFLPVDTSIMGSGMSDMADPFDPVPVPGGDVTDMVRNPMCTDARSMPDMCFSKNRATLHLHGGNTPWISDGTVHQWITPAGDAADPMTAWPEGVSVESVPDMVGQAAIDRGIPDCSADDDGCMTFYYTNQQSARLMFYHDHSWGITRLNVYSGEAAGYLITDETEDALLAGPLSTVGIGIPLVIQDKTFVPQPEQLAWQDPTWDAARWGGYGNLWYHHVYMPAQNPGDPGGMSGFGRWMYGPWFWPPAGDAKYGPIANPYYNKDPKGMDGIRGTMDDWGMDLAVPCSLDDPATWQYQEDPFCEPQLIPGTPNISAGMEQFNDTPLVNGTAYPTITLEPKSYRFRVLSAANDRFFNLQWYVGDPSTASTSLNSLGEPIGATEVALNAAEVAAAQTDPVVFPTPVQSAATAGPDWIHFGTEGGFLPAPVVVDGQQVTTWITDPTRFDVGNVDQHSLLLAPAERADVVVDFSRFAGKTLILYNDAPAAFPARIPSYDYYTGAPDLSPVGAPKILPGYGPNTRTIMQVKIAGTAAPAFNLTALRTAFSHKANGSGVFESGQHPIIVGQSTYNSAYGTNFAASGWCNSTTSTIKCDGMARISQQGGDMFTFDTLRMNSNGTYPTGFGKVSVKIEPKAIHDETNASSFDEFGRMQANLGLEVAPATPGLQNVVLHPFVFPTTEIIDASGLPAADVKVTPISSGTDGTQIWKITHNGVDTHPIHFHAYDVQLLNRVTWDNIIIPPDLTELGWKDTLRIAPLEDTIVALRPVVPVLPWDLPNSIRLLSPMMTNGTPIILSSLADGLGLAMTAFAPSGDPIDVYNHYINYGAEYVYHCHILSHEEMDMMRPVSLAYPPMAPTGLTVSAPIGSGASRHVDLTWTDQSRSETGWEVQRSPTGADTWTTIATLPSDPLNPTLSPTTGASIGGTISYSDVIAGTSESSFTYRVRAINVVGETWDYSDPAINEILPGTYAFPVVTTRSGFLTPVTVAITPDDPTDLTATFQPATGDPTPLPPRILLSWTDNANNETGFVVERSTDGVSFGPVGTAAALPGTGTVTFTDPLPLPLVPNTTFTYRVFAENAAGPSGNSNTAFVTIIVPNDPTGLTVTFQAATNAPAWLPPRILLSWIDNANNETGFVVERSIDGVNFVPIAALGQDSLTYTDTPVAGNTAYSYRVYAVNGFGSSGFSNTASVTTPAFPAAPSPVSVSCRLQGTNARCTVDWADVANNTSYTVQRATNSTFTPIQTTATPGANVTSWTSNTNLLHNTNYYFRIRANNANGSSAWVIALPSPITTP